MTHRFNRQQLGNWSIILFVVLVLIFFTGSHQHRLTIPYDFH